MRELYFLGICLAVKEEHIKWGCSFSLLIRTSFHTYQGMLSALGIGLLFGGLFLLVYYRSKDKPVAVLYCPYNSGYFQYRILSLISGRKVVNTILIL